MKRLVAALALALAALPAAAGQLVDVSVRDLDNGRNLPVYQSHGRYYVAGTPGHRYAVGVSNHTSERLLAVVSVDGVNSVTGQTASALQSGYVLDPFQFTEVRGWRKSMSETAEFYFTSVPDSYAARTDRPQNVGVIGVAVYREARPVWRPQAPPVVGHAYPDREDDRSAADAPYAEAGRDKRAAEPAPPATSAPGGLAAQSAAEGAAKSSSGYAPAPRRQDLGTGHGERRYDPASYTQFQRASSTPDEVIAVRYDDYQSLVDAGVIPQPRPQYHSREPDPFPVGFAPDPRW